MLLAGFWGLVAGSALIVGALIGFYLRVSARVIAGIMAFGGGVLISALSFDLMDEAYKRGGFDSTALGFLGGAAIYTFANWILNRAGAKHRNAPDTACSSTRRKIKAGADWPSPSARSSMASRNRL